MKGASGAAGIPTDRTFPLILAGPSGAGKTSIRDRLLRGEGAHRFRFSVSVTTRAPRRGEVEGADYRFIDRAAFEALVTRGAMLEHATVHGELYGTPSENLDNAKSDKVHLLLDIDVQGARQVRAAAPEAVSIFIVPPPGELRRRLAARGSEDAERLRRRLDSAARELAAMDEFDFVVVNEVLEDAVSRVIAIVDAEEVRVARLAEAAEGFRDRLTAELDRALHDGS